MIGHSRQLATLHTRDGLSRERLEEVLAVLTDLRVIVVGDFFLDKYLVTDPLLSERSVETGLEARQVTQIRCSPGAAGTVTNNLSALGVGQIHAVGVIGDDGEGFELERGLRATGVDTEGLLRSSSRFTPTYTKPMVSESAGERELERLDIKNRSLLEDSNESAVIEQLTNLIDSSIQNPKSKIQNRTAVIVADQVEEHNCGVVTDNVREWICRLAAEDRELIVLADSRARIGLFRNVYIKPNKAESARATSFRSEVGLVTWEAADVANALCQRTAKPVFLTMGEDGMIIATGAGVIHVLAMPASPEVDVVGAGDSVTAGIISALCAGGTPLEAACLGNLCASVTIRKIGETGTASPDELRLALSGE